MPLPDTEQKGHRRASLPGLVWGLMNRGPGRLLRGGEKQEASGSHPVDVPGRGKSAGRPEVGERPCASAELLRVVLLWVGKAGWQKDQAGREEGGQG